MQYYPQQTSMYNNEGMSSYIPSNPIGNIAPIGYGGTYSGYYTGNYNRYNPYYIQQQKELQLAQQREAQRTESSIFKKLYKASSSYLDIEVTEDALNKFDPVYEEDQIKDLSYDEKQRYYEIQNIEKYMQYHQNQILEMQGNSVPCISTLGAAYNNAYIKLNEEAKKEIPDSVGLVEYLEKYAPKKYMDALELEQKRAQSDLSQLYDKDGYSKLIKRTGKNSIFGSTVFDPDATIDDQEIRLPNLISEQTRQERRKAFLGAILQGGGI